MMVMLALSLIPTTQPIAYPDTAVDKSTTSTPGYKETGKFANVFKATDNPKFLKSHLLEMRLF